MQEGIDICVLKVVVIVGQNYVLSQADTLAEKLKLACPGLCNNKLEGNLISFIMNQGNIKMKQQQL